MFKKFGLEKYDPTNEEFDPNRHNAVFQVPDASKPAGQVAVVLKVSKMLDLKIYSLYFLSCAFEMLRKIWSDCGFVVVAGWGG